MGHTWRLFRLTQGFRWQLVWAAVLGLTASAAGIGRLALSGYALALVFQGQPFTAVFLPIAGVAACIRATGNLLRPLFPATRGRGADATVDLRLYCGVRRADGLRVSRVRPVHVDFTLAHHQMDRGEQPAAAQSV